MPAIRWNTAVSFISIEKYKTTDRAKRGQRELQRQAGFAGALVRANDVNLPVSQTAAEDPIELEKRRCQSRELRRVPESIETAGLLNYLVEGVDVPLTFMWNGGRKFAGWCPVVRFSIQRVELVEGSAACDEIRDIALQGQIRYLNNANIVSNWV